MSLSISNANPIQFWLTGEESFNQKEICSIYPVCFSQIFNCDDSIIIQFKESDELKIVFDLKVIDKNGNNLYSHAFRMTWVETAIISPVLQFTNSGFIGSLMPWLQSSLFISPSNWVWQTNGSILSSSNLSGSNVLFIHRSGVLGWPPGNYTLRIIGDNQGTSVSSPDMWFNIEASDDSNFADPVFLAGGLITAIPFGTFNKSFNFTLTKYYNYLGFQGNMDSGDTLTFKTYVNSATLTAAPTKDSYPEFEYSLTPNLFCNKEVQFQIINHNTSSIEAFSDSVVISDDNSDCTSLIKFSNSSDFAGLVFQNASPNEIFNLRIPAVFFDENYPQEQEDLELSDDTIITLWSKIEGKKTMDIGFMPFYMHKKVQIILMMDNVSIDGIAYRLRDPYQITPPASKRSALRRASVVLSEKDFINRNLL